MREDLRQIIFRDNPLSRVRAQMEQYLAKRPGLRRVFVLLDARHGAKLIDMCVVVAREAGGNEPQLTCCILLVTL